MKKYKHSGVMYGIIIFIILICLSQLNYLYQKHEALAYLDKQTCFDTGAACFSKNTGSTHRYLLGVGVSYTYESGCGSVSSGNMISIFGEHFIFNRNSQNSPFVCDG